MKPCHNVATLIERYFTERLIRQRNVSANTIASYHHSKRFPDFQGHRSLQLSIFARLRSAKLIAAENFL
jgi:hypothetical protein